MFLVVGLGNPGLEYAYTRHNVGFLFVDHFAHYLGFPGFKSKFDSLYSEKTVDGEKIIIQKPQTYMNLSGQAVYQISSYYKIPPENIFVIHDDIDIPPNNIKIKFGKGNGGHNGLRNIDQAIGNKYWRIRIGIGRPPLKEDVTNYVISKFYSEELRNIIPNVFEQLAKRLQELILDKDKDKIITKIMEEIKCT
jgi:PTH1 family peptidyl-tRNA hydrolase